MVEQVVVKGIRYRRVGTTFEYMAEARRFAQVLRDNGYLAFRRGYRVYSAPNPPRNDRSNPDD